MVFCTSTLPTWAICSRPIRVRFARFSIPPHQGGQNREEQKKNAVSVGLYRAVASQFGVRTLASICKRVLLSPRYSVDVRCGGGRGSFSTPLSFSSFVCLFSRFRTLLTRLPYRFQSITPSNLLRPSLGGTLRVNLSVEGKFAPVRFQPHSPHV